MTTLAILSPSHFCVNFKVSLSPQNQKNSSSSNKGNNNNKNQATGILLGIALKTEVNLRRPEISILSTVYEYCISHEYEYCISLHLFRSLWISLVLFCCCWPVTQLCPTLRPHGQHAGCPCPSPPRVRLNLCPLNQWWHPTISTSIVPFSSCLQCSRASGSFQMS